MDRRITCKVGSTDFLFWCSICTRQKDCSNLLSILYRNLNQNLLSAAAERMDNMAILNNKNPEIEFQLIEQLGVLDRHKTGWNREVNIVAWNGKPPKIDIRDWDPEHERMSRGITLYEREAVKLTKILAQRLQLDIPDDMSDESDIPLMEATGGGAY